MSCFVNAHWRPALSEQRQRSGSSGGGRERNGDEMGRGGEEKVRSGCEIN